MCSDALTPRGLCGVSVSPVSLTIMYLYLAVSNYLENCCFKGEFSPGDFVSVSQESSKKAVQVGDEQPALPDRSSGELLTCPNEGCVKMYQRHSSLEKHLSFGQCKMMPERHTLFDLAKTKYHARLVEGTSGAISAVLGQLDDTSESTDTLPEGWALKTTRKATRFSDTQRRYLEEKFNLGQATGQKQDPSTVARDMRFAKKMDGSKLFHSEEYLSPQQVQSYFSRIAAKSRQCDITELDIAASQDQQMLDATRQVVLDQVQLLHPIVFDNLDICAMYKGNRLKQLSISMLSTICDYFDTPTAGFNQKRKAEYIAALSELVLTCECCK